MRKNLALGFWSWNAAKKRVWSDNFVSRRFWPEWQTETDGPALLSASQVRSVLLGEQNMGCNEEIRSDQVSESLHYIEAKKATMGMFNNKNKNIWVASNIFMTKATSLPYSVVPLSSRTIPPPLHTSTLLHFFSVKKYHLYILHSN